MRGIDEAVPAAFVGNNYDSFQKLTAAFPRVIESKAISL